MKEWTFKWASPGASPRFCDDELTDANGNMSPQLWTHMDHVVLIEDNGWAFPGVALCSGQDRYSKRKGWVMARGRARLSRERELMGRSLRKSLMHGIKLDEGPLNVTKARELASWVHARAHERRGRAPSR